MVWKECLPKRRVFDTMLPCFVYENSTCRGNGWASREGWRAPIITRVCHESRAIAFETGRVLFPEDDPNVPAYIESMWSDSTTDIVAQYWRPGLESVVYWAIDDPDPYLFHYASRYQGAMIAEERLQAALQSTNTSDWTILARLKDCYVCLANPVMIHLTRREMLASQLFGRLGEEYTQLIDPADQQTLKKFHQLARTSSQQLPETMKFFDQLCTPSFQSQMHTWSHDTMSHWIWKEWLKEKQTNFSGIARPDLIWMGPPTPTNGRPFDPLSPHSFTQQGLFVPNLLDASRFSYNGNHPWVREKLAAAPRFYPRIMIRPCIQQCWRPRTPPRRGRPRGHYRAGGR
ncbi:uncharacterized protein N7482_007449 [Penicillium canariense]|uniref:Uncharacterized protein n=1 Tax=Penicillium canariense TaxID=189055 RepID=A0A9W9LJV7_9EURO|nr:uncharacterized protein N7482_007449 [Penicillium canariense]KAJ5160445.1 hypothetical protein N7482_007449 [Penicillium canariense]